MSMRGFEADDGHRSVEMTSDETVKHINYVDIVRVNTDCCTIWHASQSLLVFNLAWQPWDLTTAVGN